MTKTMDTEVGGLSYGHSQNTGNGLDLTGGKRFGSRENGLHALYLSETPSSGLHVAAVTSQRLENKIVGHAASIRVGTDVRDLGTRLVAPGCLCGGPGVFPLRQGEMSMTRTCNFDSERLHAAFQCIE